MLCAGTEASISGTQLAGGCVGQWSECPRQLKHSGNVPDRGRIKDMVLRSTRELVGLGRDSTEFPGMSPLNSQWKSEQRADVSRLQALPNSLSENKAKALLINHKEDSRGKGPAC